MRQKRAKPGYMPPAFYEWLMHLEAVEKLVTTQKYQPKPPHYLFNNTLFRETGNPNVTIREMAVVDAWLATVVRSSVKFTVSIETLAEMRDQYEHEVNYLLETRPIHLPYEWCTLVLTGLGKDDVVISLMETTAEDNDPRSPNELKAYPELGVEEGEKFISVSLCFYRPVGVEMEDDGKIHGDERLSMCPVEIHFNKGALLSETNFLNAMATGVDVTEKGKETLELVRVCIVNWIASFGLAGMLRRRQHGMTPKIAAVKPRHKRKKWDRPMFEHFVCELEIDLPAPQQAGYHADQPKKRLHQVRGFPRHLQSGKVIWVKPHWRGDRKLGVVKKDFEMTMHEDEV